VYHISDYKRSSYLGCIYQIYRYIQPINNEIILSIIYLRTTLRVADSKSIPYFGCTLYWLDWNTALPMYL